MRLLNRNKKSFYYSVYHSTVTVDEDGNPSEPQITFDDPVLAYGNISAANGQAQIDAFGNVDSYDRVIMTDDMSIPVNVNSIMWIDTAETPTIGNHDYIVKRVAKSLNSVSIAVKKVNVDA